VPGSRTDFAFRIDTTVVETLRADPECQRALLPKFTAATNCQILLSNSAVGHLDEDRRARIASQGNHIRVLDR
jgi:hypothetical protein